MAEARPDGHVLVAEDDPGVQFVVRWALESCGLKVKIANSGEEAVSSIRKELPALLVLDLTMPKGGGSHVADELRSRNDTVPILLMTGDGSAPRKAKAVGAYAYLRKPFEVGDLVSTVRRGLAPT